MNITAAVSATHMCECMENSWDEYSPNLVLTSGTGAKMGGGRTVTKNFKILVYLCIN